uniref:snRNA-activating protein complex subunit 3 n=1 Tax=Lygus hesperus TaxID=30085 RepID=A0A0A9XDC2_LYGHE
MEERYLPKHIGAGVSEVLHLEKHFNEYGAKVFAVEIGNSDKESLSKYLCTTEAEVTQLECICSFQKLLPQTPNDIQLPYDGFKPNFASQNIPECALTLKSLQALQRRSKIENKKLDKTVLRYRGEVDLEDKGQVESEVEDLDPLQYYVVKVRVYLPGVHVKSSGSSRSTFPQVSQEFLCLSSDHLTHLRNRILCSTDYQPTTGDVSETPFVSTTLRTKDVNEAAMFYLGNNFYIDARNPDSTDYSTAIREWGAARGYMLGNTFKMEETTWQNVRELRLGYPYLYVHQQFCEHLIVLTDARYLVHDNDRLPHKVAHFCTICLTLFNYMDGMKIGNFLVYKYVDRASLI